MSPPSNTDCYLIGQTIKSFDVNILPSKLEVLRVYFYNHKVKNLSQKSAIKKVISKLRRVWALARIPTSEERSNNQTLQLLLRKYRNVCRNKQRGGKRQIARENELKNTLKNLFDIAHHNAENLMKLERDRRFLLDQRSIRNLKMPELPDTEVQKQKKDQDKIERVDKRLRIERERKVIEYETIHPDSLPLSGSSEEFGLKSQESEEYQPPDPKIKKKRMMTASTVISADIAAALDRSNISYRKAVHVLAAAAKTYGEHDVSDISLSHASVYRTRSKFRFVRSAEIKETFLLKLPECPLVLHIDGKLLPAITGGPIKEDRIAILVTAKDIEKLLGVPTVERGTGELIARAAYTTICDWGLSNQIAAISFDTTSVDTGLKNGACILLEQKLEKKLLWLACRHHILEIVCSRVFEALFGATNGPDVRLFQRFKNNWPNIDQNQFIPCADIRLNNELLGYKTESIGFITELLSKQNSNEIFREDYRELLELTLIFLGANPPRGIKFRAPGAFHHARWMSKLLYIFKIYLFQNQFHLTRRESQSCLEFSIFVALVYVKAWITCPLATDAPNNDLQFIKTLIRYKTISEKIAETALTAFKRQLWYLGEELIVLSLFSSTVSKETKRNMARILKQASTNEIAYSDRCFKYTEAEDFSEKTLESFTGPSSHFLFQVLKIDSSFLEKDPSQWDNLASYQSASSIVRSLKVVNDTAERGIALATTFNKSITKKEEQKQFLFQIVEQHRQQFPDCKKSTITRT